MKSKRSCGSAGGQRDNGSMLGEATLDVLGTFLGEAIRLLILFAAQHALFGETPEWALWAMVAPV